MRWLCDVDAMCSGGTRTCFEDGTRRNTKKQPPPCGAQGDGWERRLRRQLLTSGLARRIRAGKASSNNTTHKAMINGHRQPGMRRQHPPAIVQRGRAGRNTTAAPRKAPGSCDVSLRLPCYEATQNKGGAGKQSTSKFQPATLTCDQVGGIPTLEREDRTAT